jgi:transcription factor SPN1
MSDSDSPSMPEEGRDPGDPLPEIEDQDPGAEAPASDDDDLESQLSEVDEAQFEDFDPDALADRPAIAIDESNVKLLGVHKRKRGEGADEEGRRKKKREGRREKPKRVRRRREGSEPFSGGEEVEGKRRSRARPEGGERRRVKPVIDEESLTPEERQLMRCRAGYDANVCRPETGVRSGYG